MNTLPLQVELDNQIRKPTGGGSKESNSYNNMHRFIFLLSLEWSIFWINYHIFYLSNQVFSNCPLTFA
jgi:hypothetical protein